MKNERHDVKKFSRYILLAQTLSIGVTAFGILSWIAFFSPSTLNIPYEQHAYYQNKLIWLIVGGLFILFGLSFFFMSSKNKQRLMWVLNNVTPKEMHLSLEIVGSMDSTEYFAYLKPLSEKEEKLGKWRVALQPIGPVDSESVESQKADVFFDPKSGEPAVIKTDFGFLWKLSGNGAVQRMNDLEISS